MVLAGLVLNRVHEVATTEIDGDTARAAAEQLRAEHPAAACDEDLHAL